MENDILDALNDIGYEGPLSDEDAFTKAVEGGPKSLEYTKLVHILSSELKELCSLEETVNMMNDPSESNMFLMELSSLLKEMGCPYRNLITGHMSSRLQSTEDRLLLLDYMISELMAARMVQVDKPKDTSMDIVVHESPTAKSMKEILIALKFNKPPPNITLELLFSRLEAKLKDTIQTEGVDLVGKPLYNKTLTEAQWRNLEKSYSEMFKEYKLRRETLITRLECTIRSFEWSDRLKCKKDSILTCYRPLRARLRTSPRVLLGDFLSARTSLLQVERTSNASVASDIRKLIIGRVPDRGGRPQDQQPPPPEMPSWQQRNNAPGGGRGGGGGGRGYRGGGGGGGGGRGGGGGGRGGGGGGRGGGGGGRVQGGYNAGDASVSRQQSNQSQRNYQTYEVPPGGYNHNVAGYNHGQGGYNQNQGSYNQNQGSYNQGQSGYQTRGGGGGYQNQSDGYNQGRGYSSSTGGYGQGYQQGYQQGGYQGGHRSGYQNEHDDRDRRGRSSYNRGGRQ